MIKIHDLITEAIPLSKATQLIRGWDKNRYQDWFAGKNRIYLPLQGKVTQKDIVDESQTKTLIDVALMKSGYQIKDYIEGIAVNIKYDRLQKIGKVLNKLKPDLLQPFNNDPIRQTSNRRQIPIVVISRHPYDIAGMSTDRGWTSCKNLGTQPIYGQTGYSKGMFSRYVKDEVFRILIAYLIYPDDKNITHPIARVNIVPYLQDENQSSVLYVLTSRVYGTPGKLSQSFLDTVQHWLDQKQPKQNIKSGGYTIDPFVYNDGMPSRINRRNTNDAIAWSGGIWHDGTWKDGTWEKGTWKDGIWKDGIWMNGTWQYGIWHHGTWQDGTWKDGKWKNGTWKDGTWQYGSWTLGTWQDGTWQDGYWGDGIWKDGNWKNGTWEYGIWQSGTWQDGQWQVGQWQDGAWIDGTWSDGTWNKGLWQNGTWYGGTWQDGLWQNGTWEYGTWQDGVWENGTWQKGSWWNGTWENGTWKDGNWYGGTWKTGKILDPMKHGNFEESWEWQGTYVVSPISPKEYWEATND